MANFDLRSAQKAKNDEFYTQLTDIEKEFKHYENHFKGKHIFCNCDDPEFSNFWRYFAINFRRLGIKQLTSTHYEEGVSSYRMDMYKVVPEEALNRESFLTLEEVGIDLPLGYITPLNGDGDFRSEESLEILEEADMVATNPPFSLFREYLTLIVENNKDFIILGNQNAVTYKEVFPYLSDNKVWLGINSGNMEFRVPNREEYRKEGARFWIDNEGNYWRSLGNICWFTNLDHKKRHEEIILYKKYNPEEYPNYDNYDAINIDKVSEIPLDFNGLMGVPITFLDKFNPDQFKIIGLDRYTAPKEVLIGGRFAVEGKSKYARILIRRITKDDEANEN